MTDESTVESTDETTDDDDGRTYTKPVDSDLLLEVFADLAHDSDEFELGLTLTVQGILVSGVLVSRRRWLDEMETLEPGKLSNLIDPIRNAFDRRDAEVRPVAFDFLHLIQTRMFVGGTVLPTNKDGIWRGRISEVSGWSWGLMG